MTEVGSPSNGSVQTRYSFYTASDTDGTSTLFEQNSTLSKNNSKSSSKDDNDNGNGNNNENGTQDIRIRDKDQKDLDTSAASSDMKDSSFQNEHNMDIFQSDDDDEVHDDDHYHGDEVMDDNANANAEMPTAPGDGVEDILRSLKETEDLGLHKFVKNTSLEFTHAGAGAGAATAEDANSIKMGRKTLANANSNVNSNGASDSSSAMQDNASEQQQQQSLLPHPSYYETAVKEALYHIRFRAHQRAALLKAQEEGKSTSSNLPLVSEENTADNNNNNNSNDENNDDKNNNNNGNGNDNGSANNPIEQQQTEQTDALLLAKEEEWKARRAQMAHVASILSNDANAMLLQPELEATSGSGSSSTIAGNGLPLPLHPSSAGGSLANATKLEDRLLSPPADVRKAVELSAEEMFRLYGTKGEGCGSDGQSNENSAQIKDNLVSALSGLHIANPVSSLPMVHGGDSPMHNSAGNLGGVVASAPPFSVVPSSPAPGKFHLLNAKNKLSSHLSHQYAAANSMNAENIMQQRQIELELERRWRREEEIERGVEQVLLAILQNAAGSQNLHEDVKNKNVGKKLIDDAFISLSSNCQSPAMNSASTALKMRPMRLGSQDPIPDENAVNSTAALPSTPSKSCSVVDELLAEVYNPVEEKEKARPAAVPQAPSDERHMETIERIINAPTPPSKSQSQKNNASIRPYTVEADGTLEVEAVDRGSRQSSRSVETEDEHCGEMVLGPLSKKVGGTTGVVLDNSNDENTLEMEEVSDEEGEFSSKKNKPSIKIIESITAAVRGPKANELISKLSGENKNSKGGASKNSGEEAFLPRKSSLTEIKELFAHMLPYQSNQQSKKNSSYSTWFTDKFSGVFDTRPPMHPWDDDDPEELGYIIRTYSRYQLQMIEQDYEDLMVKINKKFDTAVKRGIVRPPPKKKSERELIEGEKYRNKNSPAKSRRKQGGKGSRPSSNESTTRKSDEGRAGTSKRKLVNDRLATNPNFPNAKPAGSGEVGDLEIYHLPIIYKAHQTGFEPTKDLVLQPDTVFAGNYYVQSELGSAAFSTAYRCVDLNSGKKGEDGETYYDEVCLKVIKNTKDFFDQSLDEIKILELLRQTNQCHENNILEMKTFFYHKEHLIIVTELLRQNLFEFGKYITENDEPQYFTRDRLCYICRQCLVALSFVHKLGLVHSDIKPENILLASYSRARVKVIDFGSSCYLTDRQSSYIQSRSYRAPEVILGLPYSGKIDVWSLGCVIAEMYTGQVTFQNDSVVSMLSRIEAICGAFPRHMIENGRQSGQFFTPTGLLYEKAEFDDESEARMNNTSTTTFDEESSNGDSELFNVFQPKITTMAARLGFDPDLMEKKRTNWVEEERALFVDFVSKLLTIDPDKRPTADEALQHPWILSGYNLSEEDLKYPPEE